MKQKPFLTEQEAWNCIEFASKPGDVLALLLFARIKENWNDSYARGMLRMSRTRLQKAKREIIKLQKDSSVSDQGELLK